MKKTTVFWQLSVGKLSRPRKIYKIPLFFSKLAHTKSTLNSKSDFFKDPRENFQKKCFVSGLKKNH
jgi:hypothetical protein